MPADSTRRTSSPRRVKSAAKMDGRICNTRVLSKTQGATTPGICWLRSLFGLYLPQVPETLLMVTRAAARNRPSLPGAANSQSPTICFVRPAGSCVISNQIVGRLRPQPVARVRPSCLFQTDCHFRRYSRLSVMARDKVVGNGIDARTVG